MPTALYAYSHLFLIIKLQSRYSSTDRATGSWDKKKLVQTHMQSHNSIQVHLLPTTIL